MTPSSSIQIGLLLVILFGPVALAAQASPAPSERECAAAADSLYAGSRDVESWRSLRYCPTHGPRAVSAGIRRHRLISDIEFHQRLSGVAGAIRDEAIGAAAIEVAKDPQASRHARFGAILTILWQHDPGRMLVDLGESWADVYRLAGGTCRPLYLHGPVHRITNPVGHDYAARLAKALDEIVRTEHPDDTTIRLLARCARQWFIEVPLLADTHKIDVKYVCDTRFEVRNAGTESARLRYRVVGTEKTGIVTIPAGETQLLPTIEVGDLELSQNGIVFARVANEDRRCPPPVRTRVPLLQEMVRPHGDSPAVNDADFTRVIDTIWK